MRASDDDRLLTIGELARRSGLSIKALRLYGRSGLLAPHAVDPFTGYRTYRIDQVERARLIAALRGIGMGLEHVRRVCDAEGDVSAAQEIRAWWLQERADAASRAGKVASILGDLGADPKESMMSDHIASTARLTVHDRAHHTHPGCARTSQQDAADSRLLMSGATLLAVADGFGHDDQLAARALASFAADLDAEPSPGVGAVERAWSAAVNESSTAASDGAAITAAVIVEDRMVVAHIGDTRLFLIREGRADLVTQDHSLVRSLVASGRLRSEEAAAHPDRALLNRALSAGMPTEPDILVRRLRSGDRIVLMSDGVHAVLSAGELDGLLVAKTSAEQQLRSLVDAALAAGGPDNIAVAVASIS